MKTILVFVDGELLRTIPYKTKYEAKRHYKYFLKHGILDQSTGDSIENATFELL